MLGSVLIAAAGKQLDHEMLSRWLCHIPHTDCTSLPLLCNSSQQCPCALQYFEGKATLEQLAKSWIVSYIGNFIGCSIIVSMISGAAIFPEGAAGPLKLAGGKVALTFKQVCLPLIG